MEYVKIDADVKESVYRLDEDINSPGTVLIKGSRYTLEDLIEECPVRW